MLTSDLIKNEQIKALYSNGNASNFIVFISVTALLYLYWKVVPGVMLLSWYLFMIIGVSARWYLIRCFFITIDKLSGTKKWYIKYNITVATISLGWLWFAFIGTHNTTYEYYLYALVVFAALQGSAISSLNSDYSSYLLYVLPGTIMLLLQFAFLGGVQIVVAIGIGIYTIAMIRSMHVVHHRFVGFLQTQKGSEQLINDLLASNEKAKQLNKQLNQEVKNREKIQHKLEKETKQRQENEAILLHQSRLAAMGEMLGNIAHQWRQPLNAVGIILQKIQFLEQSGQLSPEKLEQSVEKGQSLILSMSTTIDEFRNFFQPNKQKEEFYFEEIVHEAMLLTSNSLGKNNVTWKFIAAGNDENKGIDCKIIGYKSEMVNVILNLINNACDALKAKQDNNRSITIISSRNDNSPTLLVQDNAGGISENSIEKIFEPYFSTKMDDDGTGIGLYMSKMIIEQHMDGYLTVENIQYESEFGLERGAQFKIKMPSSICCCK